MAAGASEKRAAHARHQRAGVGPREKVKSACGHGSGRKREARRAREASASGGGAPRESKKRRDGMSLNDLKPPIGMKHPKKRIGRGQGSGNGKTAGRGHKGAKSRSGFHYKRGFEGGQMPLHRRVPKRGFHNPRRVEYEVVNLD